jgi:anti-sigma factor RsiW
MSRHVDRLLTAYVEGQLTSTQAALVRQHLAECDGCRSKLANRERFVSDLNLALAYSPRPRQAQIEEWWRAIIAAALRRTVSQNSIGGSRRRSYRQS